MVLGMQMLIITCFISCFLFLGPPGHPRASFISFTVLFLSLPFVLIIIPFSSGHRNWVLCVAWSPDCRHIVSGSKAGELQCWDPQTGTAFGHPFTVKSLSLV